MAKAEIDETELVQQRNVAGLLQDIVNHPVHGPAFFKAKKELRPNWPKGTHEQLTEEKSTFSADLSDIRRELAEAKAEREREKTLSSFMTGWEKQRAVLRKNGYTDEGIEAVERLAQERGIVDLEAAEALFAKLHPPEPPVTPSGFGTWDFFDPAQGEKDSYIKKLFDTRGEDDNAALSEAKKAIQDMRAQQQGQRR